MIYNDRFSKATNEHRKSRFIMERVPKEGRKQTDIDALNKAHSMEKDADSWVKV
jgi:hypothetical protein